MKLKNNLYFLILFFAFEGSASAKKDKQCVRLVEAYSQRTLPGIPGARPTTNYHFIIVWQGAKYPETFFWRGEDGWLNCEIKLAHRVADKSQKTQRYVTTDISGSEVHKGDTLQLTPVTGGKFPVPKAVIPGNAKNSLFFRTGGSGWLSFPVKDINRKDDILMQ